MTILIALCIYLATRFGRKNSLAKDFDEWIIPLHNFYKAHTGWIRSAVALAFGGLFASSTIGYYKEWILFSNSQHVGTKDALFKKDIGFYLFDLPFIRLVIGWLFSGMVVLILVSIAAHYLNGGLRFERGHRHITTAAKVHLSILCALAGLIKAVQYYFDRFALVHSTRGAVDGATYTDVHAQLPAMRLMIFVAVIASILFIVNVYRKGVVLPLVAIALWLIVAILFGTVYPLVVQTFVVKPSRNSKEKVYTQRNIAATRAAYNLEKPEMTRVQFQQGITASNADQVKTALKDPLVWDEGSLAPWIQQKRGQQIYEFTGAERDRYNVGGTIIPSFISARQLVPTSQLPDKSWPSTHAIYTHGFGAAVVNATQVNNGNEPNYSVSELPSNTNTATNAVGGLELSSAKARVYFGQGLGNFVFVGSTKSEQTPTRDKIDVKDLGGVPINNVFKKAAFALRFSDYNILIADTVTDTSKIIYVRDPAERVKKIAPFLDIDSNPYPVVGNGEVNWIVDAYTSSDQYPYSQYVDTDNLSATSGLNKKLNYARNSVKAVVNARTGKVTLYVVDKKDPIIKAYKAAFPKLFTEVSKAPEEIVSHFRYPEDLFNVQTETFADYHIVDATTLLKGSQRWQVAPSSLDDLASVTSSLTTVKGGRADKTKSSGVPLAPLYQYAALTSMKKPEFLLTQAYVPIATTFKMDSFVSISSDAPNYGKLRVINFNANEDTSALSPTQMIGQINTDKELSQNITLLDQRGSQIISGPLQIIPVDNTVLYIQPIYVQGESSDSLPVLTYVTVSVSGQTVCAPTIDTAIDDLVSGKNECVPFTQSLGAAVPDTAPTDKNSDVTTTTKPSTNDTGKSDDLTKLTQAQLVNRLAAASDAYDKAKNPLNLGDLQSAADEMSSLIAELNKRQ